MRLPAYLKRNRHGVYCFRLVTPRVFTDSGIVLRRFPREITLSLNTRDPKTAKLFSRSLTARMASVLPQLRLLATCGDDEATAMIKYVKQLLQQLIGHEAACPPSEPAVPLGANATAIAGAASAAIPVEIIGAVVAETVKALASNAALTMPCSPAAPSPTTGAPTAAPVMSATPATKTTILSAIDDWVAVRGKKWVAKTRLEFPRITEEFAEWAAAHGLAAIDDVTRRDISAYIEELQTRHWRSNLTSLPAKRPLKKKTVNKHLAALSSLFQESKNSGIYTRAVLPTTGQFFDDEEVSAEGGSKKPLTSDDIKAVFNTHSYKEYARKPCQYFIPLLMLHHGMRVGEAAQLCAFGGTHSSRAQSQIADRR